MSDDVSVIIEKTLERMNNPQGAGDNPLYGPAKDPDKFICLVEELKSETQFLADEKVLPELASYPHDIVVRLAVQTAQSLCENGTYQKNVDVSALAERLHEMTQFYDVSGNLDVQQTLALQSIALGSLFGNVLGMVQQNSEGEVRDASALQSEKLYHVVQIQRQYCKTIHLMNMLQEQSRKLADRRYR